MSRQFQSRKVVKRYKALVHGIVRNESGTIENPIGRDRIRRTKMSTRAKISRNAHTAYRVLERFSGLTLLEVHLKSGRTHQIRVHLSSIKHPVVGDTLYGAPSKFNFSNFNFNSFSPTRNFLHSSFLSFCHPKNLKILAFSSALPEELEYLLKEANLPTESKIFVPYNNENLGKRPTLENPYLDIKYIPTPHPTADGNGYEMQLRKTSFFEIRFRVQDGLEHLLKGEYDGTFPYMLSCLMTRYLEMKTDIVLVSGVSPGFDNVLQRYSCKQSEKSLDASQAWQSPGSLVDREFNDNGSEWQYEFINYMQDYKYMYGYPKKALPVTNQDE